MRERVVRQERDLRGDAHAQVPAVVVGVDAADGLVQGALPMSLVLGFNLKSTMIGGESERAREGQGWREWEPS